MPVQESTDYLAKHAAAFEGQRANLGLTNITSKAAEGGDIPFGRAVVRGTGDNQSILPTATGQAFLGVTENTTAWSENASGLHLYEQYREMNILDYGEIWVYTEQSVVPGDSVFFRHTADTAPLAIVGRFRKDLSGGDADQIIGATFETTTAAGGIAKIKINSPGLGATIGADSSETLTATTSAISILTGITYFDSTLGATAASLADGTEGQTKRLVMMVDGGDVTITPANYDDGTTIVFNDAFDSCELLFTDGAWVLQWAKGVNKNIATVTATSGALPINADVILFDSTLGASVATLADGIEGQDITLLMTVDGGAQVVTPANLLVGTTLTFNDVGDSAILRFADGSWNVVGSNIVSPGADTIVATSGAISLLTETSLFDTTAGASTATLADGVDGQRKILKMITDGGDQVVTPTNLTDATTITFHSAGNVVELVFEDSAWKIVSIDGAQLDTDVITVVATSGAIPLTAKIVLLDTTAGVSTATLAAGYEGQRMLFKMITDGGDQVLTPASFVDGAIVTFDNTDYIELLSDGTSWMSVGTPTATAS